MAQFDFRPGVWKVTNRAGLNIRSARDTTPGTFTNVTLTVGKYFPVFRIQAGDNGWLWGDITPPGASSQQERVVCLWDFNTTFAELMTPFQISTGESEIAQALNRIADALERK